MHAMCIAESAHAHNDNACAQ